MILLESLNSVKEVGLAKEADLSRRGSPEPRLDSGFLWGQKRTLREAKLTKPLKGLGIVFLL